MIDKSWRQLTIVAVDTETTGQYPVGSEICEIAAVKWQNGQVIDTYQTLIKPSQVMSSEVIAIHGITNEMVAEAKPISEIIQGFHNFISDALMVAHHAPFDMGFLAYEFEKAHLDLPKTEVLCSSLLSRKLITEAANHRLQTLIQFLEIDKGVAHRALDDAKACLAVIMKCFEKLDSNCLVRELIKQQGCNLQWSDFSITYLLADPIYQQIVEAIEKRQGVDIVYQGGSKAGQRRTIYPEGIVRSPNGDYVVARDLPGGMTEKKKFYMDRIVEP